MSLCSPFSIITPENMSFLVPTCFSCGDYSGGGNASSTLWLSSGHMFLELFFVVIG